MAKCITGSETNPTRRSDHRRTSLDWQSPCYRGLHLDTQGCRPPEKAQDVLGVVVEVAMEKGLDLVAGYADHHARYNYSGAAIVWERTEHHA